MTATARRVLVGCAVASLAAGCGLQRAPHSSGTHLGQPGQPGHLGHPGRTDHTSRTGHSGHAGHGQRAAHSPRAFGTPTAAVAPCLISQFRIRLDTSSAGVAAGTSYLPIDFTNVGSASCMLSGFPQVTIAAGATGRQIGVAATVDRSLAPTAVVLAAGQAAHIWVRLADVANLPAAKCRPVIAAGLRVGLPGQQRATFIGHRMTSCAGQDGSADVMTVEPFRPGTARPGNAQ